MNFMPYLVLLGVALFFLLVCALLVFGLPMRSESKQVAAAKRTAPVKVKKEPVRKKEIPKVKTIAPEPDMSAATRIISSSDVAAAMAEAEDNEKTRIFTPDEMARTAQISKTQAVPLTKEEPEPDIVDESVTPKEMEEHFVRHFLNQYGAVSRTVEQDTRTVTHHLIESLAVKDKEASDILAHIMVQEALQNAQRTYVMMPDAVTLGMVKDAFLDVARGHRSEIKTILAYDALKAMPRMEMSEFHALSLLLLFHYSRNTDNVDAVALRTYAKRYIAPFISHLPEEYGGYQQLEYLRCLSLENKDVAFGRVLRDSYPLIFAFKGCMKSELEGLWPSYPAGVIVPSLYNSYYKVAAVDDGLLSSVLADVGPENNVARKQIASLMHSRPVHYDRKELQAVLKKVSPYLSQMQEAWDTSLLRRSSLTLMGMYIARICIRETIGEDFDLSHWM